MDNFIQFVSFYWFWVLNRCAIYQTIIKQDDIFVCYLADTLNFTYTFAENFTSLTNKVSIIQIFKKGVLTQLVPKKRFSAR